jgi:hypothetical protein
VIIGQLSSQAPIGARSTATVATLATVEQRFLSARSVVSVYSVSVQRVDPRVPTDAVV